MEHRQLARQQPAKARAPSRNADAMNGLYIKARRTNPSSLGGKSMERVPGYLEEIIAFVQGGVTGVQH